MPIEFPLVAQVLCDYLNTVDAQAFLAQVPDQNGNIVAQCPVKSKVPNPRPPRMVALFTEPAASAQSLTLSERRIICQIYEEDEFVTGKLSEKVRALIVDSKYRGLGIKRVKVIGEPARFPTQAVPYRWQFTADVMVRAIGGSWS